MKFDLKRHNEFLEKLKSDQKYDVEGCGHYSNMVCPICGSDGICEFSVCGGIKYD